MDVAGELALKLFSVAAAIVGALVTALIYVFKLYHAETRERIADAKGYGEAQAKINAEIIPYLATLARRMGRVERRLGDPDSDPPPTLRRISSHSREGTTPRDDHE